MNGYERARLESLSGTDASWLRMEAAVNSMTVNVLLRFAEPLSLGELRAVVEERLVPFRRFRQRLDRDRSDERPPRWEPVEHLKLVDHVNWVPFEGERNDETLRALVEDLIRKPLDPALPLWCCQLLGDPAGARDVLFRIHHSCVDGFALLYLSLAFVDDPKTVEFPMGETPPAPQPVHVKPPGRLAWLTKLGRLARAYAPTPAALGRLAGIATQAPSAVARLFTLPVLPDTALAGHALSGEKRIAWTKPLPLDEAKRAAKRHGGTLNDLLLAALTGALRRYVEERGGSVDGVDLPVVIPVNLEPLGTRRHPFGNGFGLVFLELPLGLAEPGARMRELKRRMDELKRSPEAFLILTILRTLGHFPTTAQQFLSDTFFAGRAAAVVTNVPGPKRPLRVAGREIEDLLFWVPQSIGIGLGVSIFSYGGRVRVGLLADENVVPEPDRLGAAFIEEYERLRG